MTTSGAGDCEWVSSAACSGADTAAAGVGITVAPDGGISPGASALIVILAGDVTQS